MNSINSALTIQILEVSLYSSDWAEVDFGDFVIRMSLNVKSQGNEKSTFSPKGLMIPKSSDIKLCKLLITST